MRIPSPQEEERRARGRLREQLQGELRRLQAIGRSLLLNWELPVPGRWWAELSWPGMVKAVPPWVIAQLESWKVIIEAIEEQLGKIEAELRAAAPRKLIFGEGELTHELLARELIDPARFRNSRQVGNYFGLCPSESTSERATTDGLDHQARQSAPAPLDGGNGLAGNSLSAQLSGAPPLGSAAGRSQSLRRCPQESHCRPGPSTRRRPLANRHRASPGPRTWAGLKSTAQLKNAHRRRNFYREEKLSRPRRKTLWNGAPSTSPLSAIKELDL